MAETVVAPERVLALVPVWVMELLRAIVVTPERAPVFVTPPALLLIPPVTERAACAVTRPLKVGLFTTLTVVELPRATDPPPLRLVPAVTVSDELVRKLFVTDPAGRLSAPEERVKPLEAVSVEETCRVPVTELFPVMAAPPDETERPLFAARVVNAPVEGVPPPMAVPSTEPPVITTPDELKTFAVTPSAKVKAAPAPVASKLTAPALETLVV